MALDHAEQEQVDAIRNWWRDHGGMVVLVITLVLAGLAAWQGWQWYQYRRSLEASTFYDNVVKAVQAGDAKGVRDAGGTLAENYAGSMYAAMGALVAARFHYDRGDLQNARAQLQWVVERSGTEELRDLARVRLAAVMLDEKAHDEALKHLDAPHAAAFDAQFALLRGDVLVAKGDKAQARTAYQRAIERAPKADQAFVESARMRLDALGG